LPKFGAAQYSVRMRPSAAELARTLIAGRVPATARLACRPGALTVRHATDGSGRPLLLARLDDPLVRALRGRRPPTIVLEADDAPPTADAPSLGRVAVGGTVGLIPRDEAKDAVLQYAQTCADPDLFDVGSSAILLQVEVQQIRLSRPAAGGSAWPGAANGAGWRATGWDSADRNSSPIDGLWRDAEGPEAAHPVELDDYLAADPDPLYGDEPDLLADLHHQHGARLQPYLTGRLAAAGLPDANPRAVRLDRYGLQVRPYPDWRGDPVRICFTRPVRDRSDLAQVLFQHP
jgi:hypothetical protein